MEPCCPDIYPHITVLKTGESTIFACHTLIKKSGFVVLGKYLDFMWYRKNGSSYFNVSDSKTHRHNESWSFLAIENAKATPYGGVDYHCKIFYRGTHAGTTHDVALVVHSKWIFHVEYPVVSWTSFALLTCLLTSLLTLLRT